MFTWLARLGFAGWFGASAWFGLLGAPALFRRLGTAGAAAPLQALFPSLFWFGVGSGLAALVGTAAGAGAGLRGLRLAMAGLIALGAAILATLVDPWVRRTPVGSPAFATAHGVSTLLALITWLCALVGLLA